MTQRSYCSGVIRGLRLPFCLSRLAVRNVIMYVCSYKKWSVFMIQKTLNGNTLTAYVRGNQENRKFSYRSFEAESRS